MTEVTSKRELNDLLGMIERYVVVDGYYTRRDELHIRGTAISPDNDWQDELKRSVEATGSSLRVDRSGSNTYITVYDDKRKFPWVNLLLFAATLVSVAFCYAFLDLYQSGVAAAVAAATDFNRFWAWQPFTVSLLLILLFHEFGHYLAARRPTFIGTFGAFIKSKSPFASRRDLLEVGAWGPVSGFVVAAVILAIGLTHVVTHPMPDALQDSAGIIEPLIMRIFEPIFQTQAISSGHEIFQNPMLFAAWVGLFITALNLLPVGQLDGGHIVYALSPKYHGLISRGVFVGLIAFGFLWPGWWLWAGLVFFIIRFRHPPTLDDYAPLPRKNKWLGWIAIVIFVLTFSPAPI
jgi:Zn-dependent protease